MQTGARAECLALNVRLFHAHARPNVHHQLIKRQSLLARGTRYLERCNLRALPKACTKTRTRLIQKTLGMPCTKTIRTRHTLTQSAKLQITRSQTEALQVGFYLAKHSLHFQVKGPYRNCEKWLNCSLIRLYSGTRCSISEWRWPEPLLWQCMSVLE